MEKRKIKMDYPKSDLNAVFDGKEHIIVPTALSNIYYYGKVFYLMYYRDETLGKDMMTLLERKGLEFTKIPLRSYYVEDYYGQITEFGLLLKEIRKNGMECSIDELPQHIGSLDKPVDFDGMIKSLKAKEVTQKRNNGPSGPSFQTAVLIPIFHNLVDNMYYADKECTRLIKGAPESLGVKKGNIIEGIGGIHYQIIDVIVYKLQEDIKKEDTKKVEYREKRAIQIFYNRYDNKYYYDPACTREIKGAPKSLGKLSDDGLVISGIGGVDYVIKYTYIGKSNAVIEPKDNEVEDKPSRNQYEPTYGKMVFRDLVNEEYYWDDACKVPIKNGISRLGRLSSDKSKIYGYHGDIYYVVPVVIVYYNTNDSRFYSEKECSRELIDTNGICLNLEELLKNGSQIIPSDKCDIVIKKISVSKKQKENVPDVYFIYFNLIDNKYYWDSMCNQPIEGGSDSIGRLDGGNIIGFDGNIYSVITTTLDKEFDGYPTKK